MKIALLSDCYPPRVGGIESQVSDLAARLVGAGHEVEVFTATAGPKGECRGAIEDVPVAGGRVGVHRLAEPLLGGLPVNPLAVGEMRDRLRDGAFDVAHVHVGVVSPFAWDAARVATRLGVPTALTWHCVLDRAATGYRATGVLRRWVERGAVLSAVSSFAARQVEAAAPAGTEVAVLPNAIDLQAWAPRSLSRMIPKVRGASKGEVRLVSTLRLVPRKRPVELVEAFAAAGVADRARLEIIGDGPLRGRVAARIADLRLTGRVILRGRVDRAALLETYARADGYLAPTRLEAFGIAVLEARAAGLPIVAMGGSGVDDIVEDGVDGLLVTDDAALAAAIRRLVDDELWRSQISEHNATVPPRQSWGAVLVDVEAEYRRARASR
ncbi:glycosyltransferase family 4 protein [Janibacter sp. YIM B02568]|uniref:glycosyltransferase family 4 protein n=1 Tax=Janibacter endophyticus TaxID=2806261 RepID=UPI0019501EF1|nr:glycosyltransferase family 4 protein [Janibacter endophyticus]MBM6547043.1 glycosyltransferase family 4 protein [Janibacter endophyticus]